MGELNERVHLLLATGETGAAATLVLRELGPELLGFLYGVLGDAHADDVFSLFSERLWLSLKRFEGRCSIRTWAFMLARQELGRFRKGMQRYWDHRVPISELQDVLVDIRTRTRSTMATSNQKQLTALRNELPVADRTLLILRVDRKLTWEEIALVFSETPEAFSDEDMKRETARLRKRFELIKRRLIARGRALSPLSPP
jgi:RNA polymerase sigma-70 factor, ECF subfamily